MISYLWIKLKIVPRTNPDFFSWIHSKGVQATKPTLQEGCNVRNLKLDGSRLSEYWFAVGFIVHATNLKGGFFEQLRFYTKYVSWGGGIHKHSWRVFWKHWTDYSRTNQRPHQRRNLSCSGCYRTHNTIVCSSPCAHLLQCTVQFQRQQILV